MLEIRLTDAAKRFQYDWIFRNLTLTIKPKEHIAITGSNGSGKSTLLKCLAGLIPLTEGKLEYSLEGKKITESSYYQQLSISAPYMELPEEFTLSELLDFHFHFKAPFQNMSKKEMISTMYLDASKDKQVSYFSSGMKQRLKLGLCFFSNSPLLLLDEPTSNLDQKGAQWYKKLVQSFGQDRTILVCSNDPEEYTFCNDQLHIEDYKR